MLLEGTSNIVEQVEQIPAQGEKNRRELLHFHTGQVLAIDSDTLAFYRDRGSIDDPLGNGLIGYASLPQDQQLSFDSETWVATHASGFVGLYNGFVILILPNEARLYASNEDALRNTSPICRLALQ